MTVNDLLSPISTLLTIKPRGGSALWRSLIHNSSGWQALRGDLADMAAGMRTVPLFRRRPGRTLAEY
jgi:hypothetical protein